jgi:predicted Zn-dependent peptidase
MATKSPFDELEVFIAEQTRSLHQFSLSNGARFVVLERKTTPTISFTSFVGVGAVDEPDGKTGMAHFLEHLAFKGTRRLGTKNWEEESRLLCEMDALYARKQHEPETFRREIQSLSRRAETFVDDNAFSRLVQRNGGVGLNAATEADSTQYFYNLPSNKMELWFALESERFKDPVFREFERERQVILEERLLRVENDDVGKFLEKLLHVAFERHPYRRPVIGYRGDIEELTPADVRSFFRNSYTADRLTFAIVGDVEHERVAECANRYFGDLPRAAFASGNKSNHPVEPEQRSAKRFEMDLPSNPICVEAYRVPPFQHEDTAALRVLADILNGGRLGRLYRAFIETGMASSASFTLGFPGDRFMNLGIFLALPSPGRDMEKILQVWQNTVESLQNPDNISEQELQRVRKRVRVSLLNAIRDNGEMAGLLGKFASMTGDAFELFRFLERIEAVRREDISRMAETYLRPERRITGFIV